MNTENVNDGCTDGVPGNLGNESDGRKTYSADFLSHFVELAALRALKELRESRRRERAALVGLFSAVVVVLSSVGGFLVNEILKVRVNEGVEVAIHQQLSEPRFEMDVARIYLDTRTFQLDLEVGRGITEEDLTRVRDEIGSLAETYIKDVEVPSEMRRSREAALVPLLEQWIDISAGVGQSDFVDGFYNIAPELVEQSDSLTQTLVQHTGRRLIEKVGAPEVWFDSDRSPTPEYQRYKMFATRAKETGYPELFLAFELVMRHMLERPEEELLELIRDASLLGDVDKEAFVRLMRAHASGEFSQRRSGETERIMRRFGELIDEYNEALTPILGVEEY